MNLSIAIITVSDRASQGVYEDKSGPAAREALAELLRDHQVGFELRIVPDEPSMLQDILNEFVQKRFDFIFTTGGTGIGPRDITPEATRNVIDKEIPGICEAMRAYSMAITRNAMLSRATSGIAGTTLIVNLPGSPKAVKEIVSCLGETLEHAWHMLRGDDVHSHQ
ncbi:MAG: MogA/MoaB family molybdenum cofactor biosynthesis protein [Pseudomonadota bacterium]